MKDLIEIQVRATKLARKYNQVLEISGDYYITLEQLERLLKEIIAEVVKEKK